MPLVRASVLPIRAALRATRPETSRSDVEQTAFPCPTYETRLLGKCSSHQLIYQRDLHLPPECGRNCLELANDQWRPKLLYFMGATRVMHVNKAQPTENDRSELRQRRYQFISNAGRIKTLPNSCFSNGKCPKKSSARIGEVSLTTSVTIQIPSLSKAACSDTRSSTVSR